nr:MAG TPA: hypothetical protein [Caudoviricetes sp.]
MVLGSFSSVSTTIFVISDNVSILIFFPPFSNFHIVTIYFQTYNVSEGRCFIWV